jgi:hypothetical protein
MFKTSPERRATVRRSKDKNRKVRTPEQIDADRKYFREYRRRNAHRKNEQRRERRHRHGQKEKVGRAELLERFAGLSVVSAARLQADATRWRGPRWRKEERLEKAADAILRKAARETPPQRPPEEPEIESARPPTVAHKRSGWPTGEERQPWQTRRSRSSPPSANPSSS